jgi:hypothetical protein
MGAGISVLLDVWEVRAGGDLAEYMDKGIAQSDRVLMVCTDNYVAKSNSGTSGGVPYEKQIVRAELYGKMDSHKFVPIIRNQAAGPTIPIFMGMRRYVDFRIDADYDASLDELARDIYEISSKPQLGTNPFKGEE